MSARRMRSNFLLLLTAFIWGTAFVAQSVGMDYVGAFTFNMCRFLIGGLALAPAAVFVVRREAASSAGRHDRSGSLPEGADQYLSNGNARRIGGSLPEVTDRNLRNESVHQTDVVFQDIRRRRIMNGVKGGLACGVVLFVASSFQQVGISMTTVGKSGFITALYIVLVPVCGIFMKKRVPKPVWTGVALATAGMYLMCVTESFTVNRGDICLFFCALSFTVHILLIDRVSPGSSGILISSVQFLTAGVLSAVLAFLFEEPRMPAILAAAFPILYAGVLSCGVAYTLQIVAQKDTDPTVASLLMSLESVFSLLAGWVILRQRLSGRELLGCVCVFAAVILAQLPAKDSAKEK